MLNPSKEVRMIWMANGKRQEEEMERPRKTWDGAVGKGQRAVMLYRKLHSLFTFKLVVWLFAFYFLQFILSYFFSFPILTYATKLSFSANVGCSYDLLLSLINYKLC